VILDCTRLQRTRLQQLITMKRIKLKENNNTIYKQLIQDTGTRINLEYASTNHGTQEIDMSELISIREAAKKNISLLRRPVWANPDDHIKLDLSGYGEFWPWIHIYSDMNEEINGRNPVDKLVTEFDLDAKMFKEYKQKY